MKTAIKGVVLILALLVAGGVWHGYSTGAFIGASDIHIADPVASVRDARRLLESFRASAPPEKKSLFLYTEELPESLRIPKLRHACVFRDHVNLVLGRNPDWTIGARVWSVDSTTVHADQPTAFADIFFFEYSNDLPTSPQNLP